MYFLNLIVEVIVLVVGDWLLEADEDAAGDADDEDEAQDDEGGHNDQDHQAVILLRSAEASIIISYSWVHLNINGKNNGKHELHKVNAVF